MLDTIANRDRMRLAALAAFCLVGAAGAVLLADRP